MATHNLWYGGNRMGARDVFSANGMGYWPNAALTDAQNLGAVSGHQSDGRNFMAERVFMPAVEGDEALLTYLNANAAGLAANDVIELIALPRGTQMEAYSIDITKAVAGLTASWRVVNASTGATVQTLGAVDFGVVGKTHVVANPTTPLAVNHAVRLVITAVPDPLDWSAVAFSMQASGRVVANVHPILDTSLPSV